jgi:membrane protein YqaA with SNARE-associated domain
MSQDPARASHRAQPPHDPDLLLERAAEAVAERAHSRFDRFVLRASGWLAQHTTIRLILAVVLLLGALAPGIVLLVNPDLTDRIEGFGYASVFLMNLASTATFFFPVPGLTAAAQALIATEGDHARLPWIVGMAGGLGMAIGEITAYYAGLLGSELVRGRELPGPRRFHGAINRMVAGVNFMMKRWGMATLFVLSAIPNPLFEVAGLTAGSVRMQFRRFFVSVTAGKIVRGIGIAYYGADFLDAVRHILPWF